MLKKDIFGIFVTAILSIDAIAYYLVFILQ